ncbi:YigZ family protein [Actinomycetaceae bacterium TAE3-ERU4]|nr:YigZ family protein [Actinomycetaceae bacterium TAE3-ERU4]
MLTIKDNQVVKNELEIKKSRFITTLTRADSEDSAREFIAEIKETYPDARHNCLAYIVPGQGNNNIERSSDDGEPSGTAGLPMLDSLRGAGVERICAVVTRYFGGILLGTGGLVRAYTDSVASALELSSLVELEEHDIWELPISHQTAGKVEADLRALNFQVIDTLYAEKATIRVSVLPQKANEFLSAVAALTQGQGEAKLVGTQLSPA